VYEGVLTLRRVEREGEKRKKKKRERGGVREGMNVAIIFQRY
jgi:hypothetical protein